MKTLLSSAHNHHLRVDPLPLAWPENVECAVCKVPAQGYVLMRGGKEVVYCCETHAQLIHETAHGKTLFAKEDHVG